MGFLFFGRKKKKEVKKEEVKIEETKVQEEKVVEPEVKKEVPAKGKTEAKTKANTTKKETVKKDVSKSKTSTKKVEEKKEAPVTAEKVRKVPTKKVYHVSLRKDDGKWQVKYGGGKKAIKLFDTQAEAIKFAEERADSQEGSISIHKKDGKIRKQDYSKKAEDKESK